MSGTRSGLPGCVLLRGLNLICTVEVLGQGSAGGQRERERERESVLYVRRNRRVDHLDFHTAPEL